MTKFFSFYTNKRNIFFFLQIIWNIEKIYFKLLAAKLSAAKLAHGKTFLRRNCLRWNCSRRNCPRRNCLRRNWLAAKLSSVKLSAVKLLSAKLRAAKPFAAKLPVTVSDDLEQKKINIIFWYKKIFGLVKFFNFFFFFRKCQETTPQG